MFTLLKKMTHNAFVKHAARTVASYEDALTALNNLQSNAAYLKSAKKQRSANGFSKLKEVERFLVRSGITLEKLDTLSVIHVAGTKGKGSACAYTESILRAHGFSTGFFSSPHLINVRERIRINGEPISESHFAHYFWKVYGRLEKTKENDLDMPIFFKFMTILMFHVFLDLNIDVAIVEVGIGGQFDCTNIVRNPVCVGITSLGLDHTSLLGDTLEEISYQKSGIFKPRAIAFTVPQPMQAMDVLKKRAIEKDCILRVIPPFDVYEWKNFLATRENMSNAQRQNASLAVQLAVEWMRSTNKYEDNVQIINSISHTKLPEIISMEKIAGALVSCKWPGRTQILRTSIADVFLDGAHTDESMESCISWFKNVSSISKGKKFLIFNTSGERNAIRLLVPLKMFDFHQAYFVPNYAGNKTVDDERNCWFVDEQKVKCKQNAEVWGKGSIVANSVLEVFEKIKSVVEETNCDDNGKPQILVTGSLHLVGAVLAILDPNLTMNTKY